LREIASSARPKNTGLRRRRPRSGLAQGKRAMIRLKIAHARHPFQRLLEPMTLASPFRALSRVAAAPAPTD